jgi:hypothetical protein
MTPFSWMVLSVGLFWLGILIPIGMADFFRNEQTAWWQRSHRSPDAVFLARFLSTTVGEPMHIVLQSVSLLLLLPVVFWGANPPLSLVLLSTGFVIFGFDVELRSRRHWARQNPYPWVIRRRHSLRRLFRGHTVQQTVHDFNPLSLGTSHFGLALALWAAWATEPTKDASTFWVAVVLSLVSSVFLVAAYSEPLRTVLNTKAGPYIVLITFLALPTALTLTTLQTLPSLNGESLTNQLLLSGALYLGFAWIATILAAALRDTKNDLLTLVLVGSFVLLGLSRLVRPGTVDKIGGIILIVVSLFVYLTRTGRLHPYGSIFEK